jgi:hypothetical protein
MKNPDKKLIKAIRSGDLGTVKEVIECKKGNTQAYLQPTPYFSDSLTPPQTTFRALLDCQKQDIIDYILDQGWRLQYVCDYDILIKLTPDDNYYGRAIEILEHPKTNAYEESASYIKDRSKKREVDPQILNLLEFLDLEAEERSAQEKLDEARKTVETHALIVDDIQKRQSSLAAKGALSESFVQGRKVKRKQDETRRQSQEFKRNVLDV